MQLLANEEQQQQQQQMVAANNQALLDNLNRLVISSQAKSNTSSSSSSATATATIGGFKVTVLGVQTQSKSDVQSAASSPSSMSSSSSSAANGHPAKPAPNGTAFLKSLPGLAVGANLITSPRVFNQAYVNPNSKQILEKHQKDLQRQTAVLARTTSAFHDDLGRARISLSQTFAQLRQLLSERQAQLEAELMSADQCGGRMLQQRQEKAAQLKVMADNAQHLTDHEAQELKVDIKVIAICTLKFWFKTVVGFW